MISITVGGQLEYVNHEILELVGVPLAEIAGSRWVDLLHPDDVKGALEEWLRRSTAGLPFQYFCRIRTRDDTYWWCHCLLKPSFDKQGKVVKFCGYLSKVDAVRRANEALEDGEQPLDLLLDYARSNRCLVSLLSRQSVDNRGRSRDPMIPPCTGERLSTRECNVLALIAKGQSNKRIAQTLQITPETVKSHLKRVFVKLESKTRAEAVARAIELGWLVHAAALPFLYMGISYLFAFSTRKHQPIAVVQKGSLS